MATTRTPDLARTHLEQLGSALQVRGWRVSLTTRGDQPRLKVTNPTVPGLHETILCRRAGGDWFFCWSWRQDLGPVDKITEAVNKITDVLGVEERR